MRSDKTFATRLTLFDTLTEALATRIDSALKARGAALLAVSGGQTPKMLFDRLSRVPLGWEKVTITQVDERWVEPTHPDSNARLIREHLLRGEAAKAIFVPLKNAAATPEAGHPACEAALRALARPFDVVVLGMGEDGHTASLFPGAAELPRALDRSTGDLCTPVHPPAAPHPRMSLTLRALLESRVLILPLAGQSKLAALRAAELAGRTEEMPVRAVLRQNEAPLEVWSTAEG
jgi:6-phosphogluconolactonase